MVIACQEVPGFDEPLNLAHGKVCAPSQGDDKYDGKYELRAEFKAQGIADTKATVRFDIIGGVMQNAWADIDAGSFGRTTGSQNIKRQKLDHDSGSFLIETSNGSGRATAEGKLTFQNETFIFKGTYEGSDARGSSGTHDMTGGRIAIFTNSDFSIPDYNGTYYFRTQDSQQNVIRARVTLKNGIFTKMIYLDNAKEISGHIADDSSCFDSTGSFFFVATKENAEALRYEGSVTPKTKVTTNANGPQTQSTDIVEGVFTIGGRSYDAGLIGNTTAYDNAQSLSGVPWIETMRYDGIYRTNDIEDKGSLISGIFHLGFSINDGVLQKNVTIYGSATADFYLFKIDVGLTKKYNTSLVDIVKIFTPSQAGEDVRQFYWDSKEAAVDSGDGDCVASQGEPIGNAAFDNKACYSGYVDADGNITFALDDWSTRTWYLKGHIDENGFTGTKFHFYDGASTHYVNDSGDFTADITQ